MARIELRGIAKRWGESVAVERTDLAIGDGEFVAILGPSGCGKSTTLFMLAGIYFQSYALYPHMTVRANIGFPLRFKKVVADAAGRRTLAMARLVQVEELLDRRPAQLSGGQQQRVAL